MQVCHNPSSQTHGPVARYEKLRVAHASGMPGMFSLSIPACIHGSCVTHVLWCMSVSMTRCVGENVPGIPGAYATRIFTYLARGLCIVTRWRHQIPRYWPFVRGTAKHRWIPSQRPLMRSFWCFLRSSPELMVDQTIEMLEVFTQELINMHPIPMAIYCIVMANVTNILLFHMISEMPYITESAGWLLIPQYLCHVKACTITLPSVCIK